MSPTMIAKLRRLRGRLASDPRLRRKVANILTSQGVANKEGSPTAHVDRLLLHIEQLSLHVAALAGLSDD